jgi:uncharacterized protein (DUF2336 family)
MSAIVERFLNWAQTAPIARRQEAAHALARGYLHSPLNDAERADVEAALTVLLDDPSPEVRLALADALARSDRAPHHIILGLAADKEEIAALVARHSPIILDCELVDILATREESIQVAIASRPFVSRAVSAALAEVGSAAACEALVMNSGARVLRFSLDRIVERHGRCPELRLALLERPDLPIDVRQTLLVKLTDSLRELIVENDWLVPERANSVIRDAREWATIAAAFEAPADSMPALVRELMAADALTPAFLIRSVVSGQTLLFETALAALAKVPHRRVASLIASGRESNLRALLSAAGLPKRTYPAFVAAIEVIRGSDFTPGEEGDYRRASRLIDAIVERYQRRPDRELDTILALLRRYAADARRAAAREFAQEILEAA